MQRRWPATNTTMTLHPSVSCCPRSRQQISPAFESHMTALKAPSNQDLVHTGVVTHPVSYCTAPWLYTGLCFSVILRRSLLGRIDEAAALLVCFPNLHPATLDNMLFLSASTKTAPHAKRSGGSKPGKTQT